MADDQPYQTMNRQDRPNDDDEDDGDGDGDVTFGGHDEFKLIPGGHASGWWGGREGGRANEERNHFGKVDRESESIIEV